MKIDVTDSAEFKRLLRALVDDLMDANDYFRLHQDLNAAIPDYQVEYGRWPRDSELEEFEKTLAIEPLVKENSQ